MLRTTIAPSVLLASSAALGQVASIELTPTDVGSSNNAYFTTSPTANPALFFGADFGSDIRTVDFNTAPDGPLSEGASLTNEYASFGVTMNSIRISNAIYGGNNYGTGYAAEDDVPQVYTFTTPVIAVGIVNTSPDGDLVEFYSGPNATGTLLFSFNDQEGQSRNFNIDRFVGGIADPGVTIGSFRVSNQSGNLELDELIFAIPTPGTLGLILAGSGLAALRRRGR